MSSPPSPIELVEAAAADEDVVADDGSWPSGSKLSPAAPSWVPSSIQSSPSLPNVGRLILAPRMKSLPSPAKASEMSSPVMMKSLPVPPRIRLTPLPPWMTSLPSSPLRMSSPPHVGDDVVAGAALDLVVAVAAFEPVVAAVALERVVALAGDQDVVAVGAAEDDMVVAGVLEVVGVGARRRRVVADDQRDQQCRRCRPIVVDASSIVRRVVPMPSGPGRSTSELPRLVDLEDEARRREDVGRQVRHVGVRHDSLANELFSSSVRKLRPARRAR